MAAHTESLFRKTWSTWTGNMNRAYRKPSILALEVLLFVGAAIVGGIRGVITIFVVWGVVGCAAGFLMLFLAEWWRSRRDPVF